MTLAKQATDILLLLEGVADWLAVVCRSGWMLHFLCDFPKILIIVLPGLI